MLRTKRCQATAYRCRQREELHGPQAGKHPFLNRMKKWLDEFYCREAGLIIWMNAGVAGASGARLKVERGWAEQSMRLRGSGPWPFLDHFNQIQTQTSGEPRCLDISSRIDWSMLEAWPERQIR